MPEIISQSQPIAKSYTSTVMYILINIDLYHKGAESLRIQTKYGLKYIFKNP